MVKIPGVWEVRKAMARYAMTQIAEGAAIAARMTDEEIDIAHWAISVTESLSDQRHKARCLTGVAGAMAANGFGDEALLLLQTALLSARMAGREAVLEVLAETAETIAAIDDGETLWKVYEEIAAVDAWE